MANRWPPSAPDESTELAALRGAYLRDTPEATLVALVQSSVKLSSSQGFDGGRVTIQGRSLHAGLFVEACSALRLKDTTEQDLTDARAAIVAEKDARAARDAILARLPPEVAEKLKAEASADAEAAAAAVLFEGK